MAVAAAAFCCVALAVLTACAPPTPDAAPTGAPERPSERATATATATAVARSVTVTAGDTAAGVRVAERLRVAAPEALRAVAAFWGEDWPAEVPVEVATDDADFARRVAPATDAAVAPGTAVAHGTAHRWADVAAVTVADAVDPVRRLAPGRRIVVAAGVDRLSAASLQMVLTHELVHYATRADIAATAPAWLVEGVADHVARPAAPIPAGARAVLPTDADLAADDPVRRADAYDRAWWFCRFVAERFGERALRDYTLAVAGVSARDPRDAAADLLDDWPTLVRRWQAWLVVEAAAR